MLSPPFAANNFVWVSLLTAVILTLESDVLFLDTIWYSDPVHKTITFFEAVDKVVKIETATEPRFQEFFVEAMKFSVSPVKQQQTKKVRRRKRVS